MKPKAKLPLDAVLNKLDIWYQNLWFQSPFISFDWSNLHLLPSEANIHISAHYTRFPTSIFPFTFLAFHNSFDLKVLKPCNFQQFFKLKVSVEWLL